MANSRHQGAFEDATTFYVVFLFNLYKKGGK